MAKLKTDTIFMLGLGVILLGGLAMLMYDQKSKASNAAGVAANNGTTGGAAGYAPTTPTAPTPGIGSGTVWGSQLTDVNGIPMGN